MIAPERWRGNLALVRPVGALVSVVPGDRRGRRRLEAGLRALQPGAEVVLEASGLLAARRCRMVAGRAGIELRREYAALPSARAPAYLVEDAPAAAALFVGSLLAPPPRSRLATPVAAVLWAMRRMGEPSRLLRMLAPGRVAGGRRR
jgi:hypothetical protein